MGIFFFSFEFFFDPYKYSITSESGNRHEMEEGLIFTNAFVKHFTMQ